MMRKGTVVLFALGLIMAIRPSAGGGESSAMKKAPSKPGRPSLEETATLTTIRLRVENRDGDLVFSWTPATGENSGGVKLAYSEEHDNPLYPHDPYAAWLPGGNQDSCTLPNRKAASKQKRFYRVCSVRAENHGSYLALSNVVKVDPVEASAAVSSKKGKAKSDATWKDSVQTDTKKPSADGRTDGTGKKVIASPSAPLPCSSCGWNPNPGDRYCAHCGASLKAR